MSRYDYVAVGHVTCDVLGDVDGAYDPDGGGGETGRAGGTAFYSALQAARLGLRAMIVTQGLPAQIEQLLAPYGDELDLHVIAAAQTTTLATDPPGPGQRTDRTRRQRLLAWAGAIVELPKIDTSILHLAPVARETPRAWRGQADFVGMTPQGLVREWPEEEIVTVELERSLLPERFDAAVISEHERLHCAALFAAAQACGACVAVTAGPQPVQIHAAGDTDATVARRAASRASAAPPATTVCEDIGAGDVFAAAFFVALGEGHDPLAAASFANAAAAVRIAGKGAAAIGTRPQVQALLA